MPTPIAVGGTPTAAPQALPPSPTEEGVARSSLFPNPRAILEQMWTNLPATSEIPASALGLASGTLDLAHSALPPHPLSWEFLAWSQRALYTVVSLSSQIAAMRMVVGTANAAVSAALPSSVRSTITGPLGIADAPPVVPTSTPSARSPKPTAAIAAADHTKPVEAKGEGSSRMRYAGYAVVGGLAAGAIAVAGYGISTIALTGDDSLTADQRFQQELVQILLPNG